MNYLQYFPNILHLFPEKKNSKQQIVLKRMTETVQICMNWPKLGTSPCDFTTVKSFTLLFEIFLNLRFFLQCMN